MKAKKLLSLALVAAMTLSMAVTPVWAASGNVASTTTADTSQSQTAADHTINDQKDGEQAVMVYATVVSSYSVKIPKVITLDGGNKTGGYTIDVNGDIADNETVNVVAPADFLMKSTTAGGKEDVEATIGQSKSAWKWNELNENATGTITATGLTAGKWNGTFNFDISLTTD